jgi:hypothetical protein
MSRSTVFAVASGVWFSGAVSAAALGYVMTRPLAPSTSTVWSQMSAGSRPAQEARATEAPYVLEMPVFTIVGRITARVPAAAVESPVARDIAEMRCADWRDLDIGSGRVRVCE